MDQGVIGLGLSAEEHGGRRTDGLGRPRQRHVGDVGDVVALRQGFGHLPEQLELGRGGAGASASA